MSDARYERKFHLEGVDRQEVEMRLRVNPGLFRPIYHARHVNNLYFDTLRRESYADNVDGLSARTKVRIRWYGPLFGDVAAPVLEVKRKRGHEGIKDGHRLPPMTVAPGFDPAAAEALLRSQVLPESLRAELASYEVRLMNRYQRRYYLSADGRLRITLDDRLEWYGVSRVASSFMACHREPDHVVLELKYDCADHDAIRGVTRAWPFRMTRSSKYVNGVDLLRLAE